MGGDAMTAVVTAREVSKTFGDVAALDKVSFTLEENRVYGLLGRNGGGKSTLMQILTGQQFATSGDIPVLGTPPLENDGVLRNVCFIRESQRPPRECHVPHLLPAAAFVQPNWDPGFAG